MQNEYNRGNLPECPPDDFIPISSKIRNIMKSSTVFCILMIAAVNAVALGPLSHADLERFRKNALVEKKFSKICDLYFTVQLAKELKVDIPKLTCDEIPVNQDSMEEAYYTYAMLQEYKCTPIIPENVNTVISNMESLQDVFYAACFPTASYDPNALAMAVYQKLDACNTLECTTLSLADKSAAISMLSNLEPYLSESTKSTVASYKTIAKTLLSDLREVNFIADEPEEFFSIADLTLTSIKQGLVQKKMATRIAKYFLSFRTTSHSCYAFYLIFVINSVKPLVSDSLIFSTAKYTNDLISINIVDVADQSIPDLDVSVTFDNESPINTVYSNGVYSLPRTLQPGIHEFHISARDASGRELVSQDSQVVSFMQIHPTSFTLSIDKKETPISLPSDATAKIGPKTAVSISIPMDDVIPQTSLILMENDAGRKITLPMTIRGNILEVSFQASRKDVALAFDYQSGDFSFSLLLGDQLLETPVTLPLFQASVEFGEIPAGPVYPIYSKPLLYESEGSVKPLKEISHVFQAESKNPVALFPLGFSAAIIGMLVVLVMLWSRVGLQLKKESMVQGASRFVFWMCIVAIVTLYVVFWYGWNLISLLKVLVPLAVFTALVGNRAL